MEFATGFPDPVVFHPLQKSLAFAIPGSCFDFRDKSEFCRIGLSY